jgi:RND family efflux transporter MFP subunit
MTHRLVRLGRFTILVLLTIFACAVMWWTSRRLDEADALAAAVSDVASPARAALPRTLVQALPLEPAVHDVVVRYSGKIQAWETYSLGFEVSGRVAKLGENAAGEPLDDGDRVEKGQLLARLDDRIFRARLAESVANFEMAASDVERGRRARDAITEAEFQTFVTTRAQAQAAQEIANKNLDDSVLTSPVTGTIARRMVEAGESVAAHEVIFELVENERLRLVVNIPEARVRELELRRRQVLEAKSNSAANGDPESGVFRAHVQLEGRDLYGKDWPAIDAEVYRVAERADPATGLFEVEIAIDNRAGLLRPGMVATAGSSVPAGTDLPLHDRQRIVEDARDVLGGWRVASATCAARGPAALDRPGRDDPAPRRCGGPRGGRGARARAAARRAVGAASRR